MSVINVDDLVESSREHEAKARSFVMAHVEREFAVSAARVARRAEMRRRHLAAVADMANAQQAILDHTANSFAVSKG